MPSTGHGKNIVSEDVFGVLLPGIYRFRGVKCLQYKKAMSSVCHLCACRGKFPWDRNPKIRGEAQYLHLNIYICIVLSVLQEIASPKLR